VKKFIIYAIWLLVSFMALAVIKNIAHYEFPKYSPIIMGVAYAVFIYSFFMIRNKFAKTESKSDSTGREH
jgi:hypothetical protein